MILDLTIAFLAGIIYATLFVLFNNKKQREQTLEAYEMGFQDGKQDHDQDVEILQNRAYEQGYAQCAHDLNQDLEGTVEEDEHMGNLIPFSTY
jgi:hypothetical protein